MIGVAVTTWGRPELSKSTLREWQKYLPKGAVLIAVEQEGIAKAKNLSLKILEQYGVTDYFLVDNDVVPLSKDWYKPYIDSGENHLMLQFDLPGSKLKEVYRDDKLVAYDKTRGCFLYVTQLVLDTVGGFDTRYKNSFDHPDYTTRIYNAGLTTHRAADVVGSEKLLHCLDKDGDIESTISKNKHNLANYRLYNKQRQSKEYMEYR